MFPSIDCPAIYNLNSVSDVQVVLIPKSHKLFLPSEYSGALFATCMLTGPRIVNYSDICSLDRESGFSLGSYWSFFAK